MTNPEPATKPEPMTEADLAAVAELLTAVKSGGVTVAFTPIYDDGWSISVLRGRVGQLNARSDDQYEDEPVGTEVATAHTLEVAAKAAIIPVECSSSDGGYYRADVE